MWVLVGPADGAAAILPYMVRSRGCKQRAAVNVSDAWIEALSGWCRRPSPAPSLPRTRTPPRYRGGPHFGLIDILLLFSWISPFPPSFHPLFLLLRCRRRPFAVLPPLRIILLPPRQAPLGNIAVLNPIMLSQRCQLNPPHFIPLTHPPLLLTNRRSSIY